MNTAVVKNVLQAIIDLGAREFCICPGSRNVSLIALIKLTPELQAYYFNDERSAAFFALGKSQASGKPVAIITTSGTAVSYLLGAAMEAYYTGIPLLLITADRPRRFRHTNAPQSCEQKGIYGLYTKVNLDLEGDEPCDLSAWDLASPVHINICLEEPLGKKLPEKSSLNVHEMTLAIADPPIDSRGLEKFLDRVHYPLTVVGGLKPSARESVMHFLNRLNIPVFLEGISGLREEPSLQHLRITRSNRLWEKAEAAAYPIDGILRIGGVPTFRLWRDLEDKEGIIQVYSINDVPFSGLSWGPIYCAPLDQFFQECTIDQAFASSNSQKWLEQDHHYHDQLQQLFQEEPQAEPSLIHRLSQKISGQALVYLGNSLPIRQWDMTATNRVKHSHVCATRGLAGIDGQTSAFLGMCSPAAENWALLGDLTTLHDLGGPWILQQMPEIKVNICVVNNGGGKIFEKMYPYKELQNCHDIHFEPFAKLWNLRYECWEKIPQDISSQDNRLIEILPEESASKRFWDKLATL